MDLADFAHTKKKVRETVYSHYLSGKSVEEILILSHIDEKTINNVIDCCNYLYL